jgi:hypothetical protein
MNKVSESIFSGKAVVIPMADVSFFEKRFHSCDLADGTKKGDLMGLMVVFNGTKYNTTIDDWENNAWIGAKEANSFIEAWAFYRHELEGGKDGFKAPEEEL